MELESDAPWDAAYCAYILGRLGDAAAHTDRALRRSVPSSLIAAALATNQAALSSQHDSLPPLPETSSDCSAHALFARELLLTRAYNHALTLASAARSDAALVELGACDAALDGLPTPAALCAQGHTALPKGASPDLMRRICDAAAEAYQLRCALELLRDDYDGADSARRASLMWHGAGAAVVPLTSVLNDPASDTVIRARDETAARAACLQSLALACSGDYAAAVHALNGSVELSEGAYGQFPPAIYASAAFRACCALDSGLHDQRAVAQLEYCARTGYRAADAHALAARLHNVSSRALLSFQAALALDHKRPATLFAAANRFERAAEYDAQAELLSCAGELVQSETPLNQVATGFVQVSKPWTPSRAVVDLALSRALVLDGKPFDALSVLRRVPETEDAAGKHRILATATAGSDDSQKAVDTAVKFAHQFSRNPSAELLLADAHLCNADVRSAMDAIKRISLHKTEDPVSSALRGITYNNIAVLKMCTGEVDSVDGAFAGAQVAFDKSVAAAACGTGVNRWMRKSADAASWNRMLAIASRGRLDDAASHWIARRRDRQAPQDVDASFGVANSHVMGMLDDSKKKAMDQLCARIDETSRHQQELGALLRHILDRTEL